MPRITAAATINAPMKATLPRPRPRAASGSVLLAAKDAIGPHRQGHEQHTERNRRRPRWAEESRGQALDDAEGHRRNHHAGKAAEPAQHADGEDPADIFTTDRRFDWLDDDQGRAG